MILAIAMWSEACVLSVVTAAQYLRIGLDFPRNKVCAGRNVTVN